MTASGATIVKTTPAVNGYYTVYYSDGSWTQKRSASAPPISGANKAGGGGGGGSVSFNPDSASNNPYSPNFNKGQGAKNIMVVGADGKKHSVTQLGNYGSVNIGDKNVIVDESGKLRTISDGKVDYSGEFKPESYIQTIEGEKQYVLEKPFGKYEGFYYNGENYTGSAATAKYLQLYSQGVDLTQLTAPRFTEKQHYLQARGIGFGNYGSAEQRRLRSQQEGYDRSGNRILTGSEANKKTVGSKYWQFVADMSEPKKTMTTTGVEIPTSWLGAGVNKQNNVTSVKTTTQPIYSDRYKLPNWVIEEQAQNKKYNDYLKELADYRQQETDSWKELGVYKQKTPTGTTTQTTTSTTTTTTPKTQSMNVLPISMPSWTDTSKALFFKDYTITSPTSLSKQLTQSAFTSLGFLMGYDTKTLAGVSQIVGSGKGKDFLNIDFGKPFREDTSEITANYNWQTDFNRQYFGQLQKQSIKYADNEVLDVDFGSGKQQMTAKEYRNYLSGLKNIEDNSAMFFKKQALTEVHAQKRSQLTAEGLNIGLLIGLGGGVSLLGKSAVGSRLLNQAALGAARTLTAASISSGSSSIWGGAYDAFVGKNTDIYVPAIGLRQGFKTTGKDIFMGAGELATFFAADYGLNKVLRPVATAGFKVEIDTDAFGRSIGIKQKPSSIKKPDIKITDLPDKISGDFNKITGEIRLNIKKPKNIVDYINYRLTDKVPKGGTFEHEAIHYVDWKRGINKYQGDLTWKTATVGQKIEDLAVEYRAFKPKVTIETNKFSNSVLKSDIFDTNMKMRMYRYSDYDFLQENYPKIKQYGEMYYTSSDIMGFQTPRGLKVTPSQRGVYPLTTIAKTTEYAPKILTEVKYDKTGKVIGGSKKLSDIKYATTETTTRYSMRVSSFAYDYKKPFDVTSQSYITTTKTPNQRLPFEVYTNVQTTEPTLMKTVKQSLQAQTYGEFSLLQKGGTPKFEEPNKISRNLYGITGEQELLAYTNNPKFKVTKTVTPSKAKATISDTTFSGLFDEPIQFGRGRSLANMNIVIEGEKVYKGFGRFAPETRNYVQRADYIISKTDFSNPTRWESVGKNIKVEVENVGSPKKWYRGSNIIQNIRKQEIPDLTGDNVMLTKVKQPFKTQSSLNDLYRKSNTVVKDTTPLTKFSGGGGGGGGNIQETITALRSRSLGVAANTYSEEALMGGFMKNYRPPSMGRMSLSMQGIGLNSVVSDKSFSSVLQTPQVKSISTTNMFKQTGQTRVSLPKPSVMERSISRNISVNEDIQIPKSIQSQINTPIQTNIQRNVQRNIQRQIQTQKQINTALDERINIPVNNRINPNMAITPIRTYQGLPKLPTDFGGGDSGKGSGLFGFKSVKRNPWATPQQLKTNLFGKPNKKKKKKWI